ncbi:MAG: Phosphoribosylamine--glycine ligase [uncultured Acidimicrobiales bacterium]|uniref:Phosphoribosylamine--glycine ligase n=1 Tax=uncultured Acidimicrobiales bacterium TaxID=310071 RepID=A0A6J4JGQ2_9ACTN|nr:MAG: Phosphoribosylamine--glycine ligase [uncultured Acidimicrobiales bacterium]
MKVVVVGSGGREHALAWALGRAADVVVVPGNAGMAHAGVACAPTFAAAGAADLVVVGPEQPLVEGLADRLRSVGTAVFGPGAAGARLEGSKAHLKEVMGRACVPTADSRAFSAGEEAAAETFLRSMAGPWVVKTDGLAAGKGVLVADDVDDAVADVQAKLSGASFGVAGQRVVIEEGLTGPEVSVLAVCDGRAADDAVVVLPVSRDHKRVGDGDTGPNTGGMGAFSPVGGLPANLLDQVLETMVLPTLHTLVADGVDYRGVLYAGIMLTPDGPKLLEYNVRFGDPEAQVVLPRLEGDFAALLASAAAGRVDSTAVAISPEACVGIVLAAPGYPTAPVTGGTISGLEEAGPLVFSAGVAERDGRLVTAGGRVLCVAALGPDGPAARRAAYDAADQISFEGGLLRREDIAATA